MNKIVVNIISILILTVFFSCIDEIPLKTESIFESILIVEASITSEEKQQIVKLSRSYALEESGPSNESGANVVVVSERGERINFIEVEPGVYKSDNVFKADQDINYQLEIRTIDGREYVSEMEKFQSKPAIDNLYVEQDINENNELGVSVYVDVLSTSTNGKYFRFEYEETYKIIAPQYNSYQLIIQNEDYPFSFEQLNGLTDSQIIEYFVLKELKPEQSQICYNTEFSNEIILANSSDYQNNTIEKLRIRFLSQENYIISHRYSILIKQFEQSYGAYLFYSTLKNLSESESIFSDLQPGFIAGNITSKSDPSEPVGGYFEVASFNSKRIYFSYEDLFPDALLPPYYIACDDFFVPPLYQADPISGEIGNSPIQDLIKQGYHYFEDNEDGSILNPYKLVRPACGDCTVIGETKIPDFWEE